MKIAGPAKVDTCNQEIATLLSPLAPTADQKQTSPINLCLATVCVEQYGEIGK